MKAYRYTPAETDGKRWVKQATEKLPSKMEPENVSMVAFTFAAASLLAGGILSMAVGIARGSWLAVLSAAICLVAWSVYSMMIKAEKGNTLVATRKHMRMMDWLVREPVLLLLARP